MIVVPIVMAAYTALTTPHLATPLDAAFVIVGWTSATLAWRRPLLGGVVLGTLLTTAMSIPSSVIASLTLPLWVPLAMSTAMGRRRLGLTLGTWYLMSAVAIGGERGVLANPLLDGLVWFFFVATPLCIGSVVHHYLHLADGFAARQKAALEETRQALARSLHDTVVSTTTSIVMLAETAKLHDEVDPLARERFDVIATTGRRAIDELRQLLELLREDPRTYDQAMYNLPVDRLEISMPTEIAKIRALGTVVDVQVEGDLAQLDGTVSTSLTRMFAEAVSNVAKHADLAASVTVMVDVTGDEADLVVINGVTSCAAETAAQVPHVGGGAARHSFGLIGMREVAVAGGGTAYSRRIEDRWVTEVTVPRRFPAERARERQRTATRRDAA